MAFLIIIAILILVLYLENIRELTRYKIRTETIYTTKLAPGENVRLVFLSDLHNREYGKKNSALIKSIQELSPDIILCGGDMLIGNAGKTDYTIPYELFRELAGSAPIYLANGNHEQRIKLHPDRYGTDYEKYAAALKELGVHLLENASTVIDAFPRIQVTGLEINEKYYRKFRRQQIPVSELYETIGDAETDQYNILLAHHPEYASSYAEWGADLILSGHLHGGVVGFPGGRGLLSTQAKAFPQYAGGRHSVKTSELIVSRGLGIHTVVIRLFNPAELIAIELKGIE